MEETCDSTAPDYFQAFCLKYFRVDLAATSDATAAKYADLWFNHAPPDDGDLKGRCASKICPPRALFMSWHVDTLFLSVGSGYSAFRLDVYSVGCIHV